jgi:hypothetical protein
MTCDGVEFIAGPKAVCQEEEECIPAPLTAEQVVERRPSALLELLWRNFKKARRHLSRVATLDPEEEAEVRPMHIVQKDETLSSIARVRE